MLILGDETSCDETAAAVVRDGRQVLSSLVASQDRLHARFGGVVPEIASRAHLEVITRLIREALEQAGVKPAGLDAVAVVHGPGLVGALLIGLTAAKTFAWLHRLPLVPVNHVAAHIYAANLPPEVLKPPPLLTGNDLIAMGYTPGPLFSEILDAVEDAQLEGRLTSRDEAREFVRGRWPL